MDCAEARLGILDEQRNRISASEKRRLDEHVAECPACRAEVTSERTLTEILASKLPRRTAPTALQRRLDQSWPRKRSAGGPIRRLRTAFLAAAAAVLLVAGTAVYTRREHSADRVADESVNDHLRMLEGAPLARVEGGLHEVRPWFGGKLDFAPAVMFAGDSEFGLRGGAVERFLDRRGAVLVYERRLHVISLFAVRADGLPFPSSPRTATVRGFHLVLWKVAGQGFALVSDLSLPELLDLQRRIATAGQ